MCDTLYKKKTNTKPRFELSIDSSTRARQHSLSARGKSARYAREFSFARCDDATDAIILHGSAAGYTSRTGRSNSPAAQSIELKKSEESRILELRVRKSWPVPHSTNPGRHGRRQEQKVYSPGLLQGAEFWRGRHRNDGVLCTACT